MRQKHKGGGAWKGAKKEGEPVSEGRRQDVMEEQGGGEIYLTSKEQEHSLKEEEAGTKATSAGNGGWRTKLGLSLSLSLSSRSVRLLSVA